jgi:hypothetical protein
MTPQRKSEMLSTATKLVPVIAALLTALFWIFAISAKADNALELGKSNSTQIEKKADKDSVEKQFNRLYDKIESLDDYLRNQKR